MTIARYLIAGLITVLFLATPGKSQPGPQTSPSRNGDPSSYVYEYLLKGKEEVNRQELDPARQRLFDRFARKLGVTNGRLSRGQIDSLLNAPMPDGQEERSQVSSDWQGGREISIRNTITAALTTGSPAPAADSWRRGQAASMSPSLPAPNAPIVYHSHNLPKQLPAWFQQLDTNHDAQIGLYEWKVSGRSIAEFQRMDRNNDGFLTVEEVLGYLAETGQLKSGQVRSAPRGGVAQSTSMTRDPWAFGQPD
jgi:EF hand